jgi:hypothetical protein
VDAHRVEVFDRADDHDVVVLVANYLELELAPTLDGLFDQHLRDRRRRAATIDVIAQLFHRRGEATTLATEREGRADHHWQPQRAVFDELDGLLDICDGLALGRAQTNARHRLREQLAVLGRADRVDRRADQLDAKLV